MAITLVTCFRLLASGLRLLGLRRRPAAAGPCMRNAGASPHASLRMACTAPPRPLRVVRVVDAGQGRAAAGRMVISGRLADVCAELDRLAAQEAAQALAPAR